MIDSTRENRSSERRKTTLHNAEVLLVAALLVVYVAAVLSLRFLPTQDGQVLCYYSNVLRSLESGGSSHHSYYAVARMSGAHSFFFHLMALWLGFLNPLAAEKLFIALCVLGTVLAFRYLVCSAHPPADMLSSLLAFPFVLSPIVYLGLYDFSIAVPMVLFACGYWLRFYQRLTPARWAIALFLIYLILTMHLVAAVVFLMFAGVHVAESFFAGYAEASGGIVQRVRASLLKLRKPLVYLGVAGLLSMVFAIFGPRPGRHLSNTFQTSLAIRIKETAAMRPLSPYESRGYRGLLGIALVMGLALFIAAIRRAHRSSSLKIWTFSVVIGLCAVGYFAVPDSLTTGDAYFPLRFAVFAAYFLFAAAGQVRLQGVLRPVAISLAALVAVMAIAFQTSINRPMVANLNPLLDAPPVRGAALGALVNEGAMDPALEFSPPMWFGANYLQRSGAAMLNNPWLGPHSWLSLNREQPCQADDPRPMVDCLLDLSPADRPPLDLLVDLRSRPSPPQQGREIARRYGLTREMQCSPTISIFSRPPAGY